MKTNYDDQEDDFLDYDCNKCKLYCTEMCNKENCLIRKELEECM